jgi:2-polyprenyl-3-methyl-5-hydroxy-6-metoxy-1,4-benzoquinol methylase
MNSISCIFCSDPKTESRVVIEENGFTGRKCANCGLIYISPRPDLKETQELYGHDQAHIPAGDHLQKNFGKYLHDRHMLSLLEPYKKQGKLLDIGAGGGKFLLEARKAGYDVSGIELNPNQSEYVQQELGIPCEAQPLAKVYQDQKFDVIYHCDVISHFYDPIAEFRLINERLKEGGLVFFETGNIGDIAEKYYSVFTEFQYPDHLFFFGEKNLKILLQQTGFELLEIRRYSILPQLKVRQFLFWVLKNLRRTKTGKDQKEAPYDGTVSSSPSPSASVPKQNQGIPLPSAIKMLAHAFLHFLRYVVGRRLPKTRRPQTLVMIAKKI